MFSWYEQYFTRSLRSLVRYCSCHSNIKFISSHHRVISSISNILERVKAIQQAKDRETPLPDNIPHMAIAITKNIAYAEQVSYMWDYHWGNHGTAVSGQLAYLQTRLRQLAYAYGELAYVGEFDHLRRRV